MSLILFVCLHLKKWCCLVIQQLWFLLIWCDINKKLPNFVGEGHGNPFQYSCPENPMEPGRLQSMGSQELDMTEQLKHTILNIIFVFVNAYCTVAKLCPTLCDPIDCKCQPPLSSSISWSLLKFMSVESVILSNHLILCCTLLFLPLIFLQWATSLH